jgi:hypothetical protein
METVATPVTFLSLFTLLPSVQNLFFFATAAAVCFDYASAIDIVCGADAQGWPTNHFTELSSLRCYCCTGGNALNNEMKKDKRMRAIAGWACRSATAESGAELDRDRQKSVTETGYDLGPNDTMAHEWLGGRGATRPTVVDAAFH